MTIFGVEFENPFAIGRDKRVRMSFTQRMRFMGKVKNLKRDALLKAVRK